MATHRGIVLLVDDDDDVRDSVRALLEDEGYLVLEARGGKEALHRVRGLYGQVVALVDLSMPDMGGRELIQRLRSEGPMPAVPIVVITGHSRAKVDGAQMVMEKPLSPARLLKAVEQYCR